MELEVRIVVILGGVVSARDPAKGFWVWGSVYLGMSYVSFVRIIQDIQL